MKRFFLELLISSGVIAAILYGIGCQDVVLQMIHRLGGK